MSVVRLLLAVVVAVMLGFAAGGYLVWRQLVPEHHKEVYELRMDLNKAIAIGAQHKQNAVDCSRAVDSLRVIVERHGK